MYMYNIYMYVVYVYNMLQFVTKELVVYDCTIIHFGHIKLCMGNFFSML